MIRTLILVVTILFTSLFHAGSDFSAGQESKVYVVMSENAYAYHKTLDCRAVKKATHVVKEVTLEEAQEMGRKPCGICYSH